MGKYHLSLVLSFIFPFFRLQGVDPERLALPPLPPSPKGSLPILVGPFSATNPQEVADVFGVGDQVDPVFRD